MLKLFCLLYCWTDFNKIYIYSNIMSMNDFIYGFKFLSYNSQKYVIFLVTYEIWKKYTCKIEMLRIHL